MGFHVRRSRLNALEVTEGNAVVMDWGCAGHVSGASFNWYMSPAQADALAEQLTTAARDARELLAGGAAARDALAADKAVR
jgi:hypothetical protein